jgi:hypothetical protein
MRGAAVVKRLSQSGKIEMIGRRERNGKKFTFAKITATGAREIREKRNV